MNCPSCGHENIDGSDRCENCLAPFRDLDVPRIDAAESFAQSVMEDNLGQLEFEPPVFVAPGDAAGDVARRMKEASTGCALVLEDNNLVGIFTEHDVLLHLTGNTSSPPATALTGSAGAPPASAETGNAGVPPATAHGADFNVPVKDLMSANPESLHEQDSVAEALNRMSLGRYRHLPVRKSDGSYAVASIKSVLSYIAKEDW